MKRDPQKAREWQERSARKAAENARNKPRKAMKRTVPKKRGRKHNGQPHDIIEQARIDAMRRFHDEARKQRVCARCGSSQHWDAHHVVEKQWLKANGFSPIEQYDPDNALRLCDELSDNDCHGKHTRGVRNKHRLHLHNLTDRNLAYAFRVMGPAAGSYLRRKYRGEDERLDALERTFHHEATKARA